MLLTSCGYERIPKNIYWIQKQKLWKLENKSGWSSTSQRRSGYNRHNTIYLRLLETWRKGQLNLAHGKKNKSKNKNRSKETVQVIVHEGSPWGGVLSPSRRPAATCCDVELWPPESNQVISSGLVNIPRKFHRDCSSRSWDIMVKICLDEQTNGQKWRMDSLKT